MVFMRANFRAHFFDPNTFFIDFFDKIEGYFNFL